MLCTHCSPEIDAPVSAAMAVRDTDTALMGSCAIVTPRIATITGRRILRGRSSGVAG